MTPAMASWLGYEDAPPMLPKPFGSMLEPAIADDLRDGVDFEPGGADVADMLKKFRQLQFRRANGQMVPSHVTVSFAGMDGMNLLYNVRLEDEDHVTQSRRGASKLAERMRHKAPNTMDAETRLPDSASFGRDMMLVLDLMDELHGQAFLLMVEPCSEPVAQQLHDIGVKAKECFRASDVVARAGQQALGIILMDTNHESARLPVERFIAQLGGQAGNVWFAGCQLEVGDQPAIWARIGQELRVNKPSGGQVLDLRAMYKMAANT